MTCVTAKSFNFTQKGLRERTTRTRHSVYVYCHICMDQLAVTVVVANVGIRLKLSGCKINLVESRFVCLSSQCFSQNLMML